MTTQVIVQGAENGERRNSEKIKLAQPSEGNHENCNEFTSGQEPGIEALRNEASGSPNQSMEVNTSESDELTSDLEATHPEKHTNNGDGAGEMYTQNENGGETPMDTVDTESDDQMTDPMGKAAVDADVGDAASKTEDSANLENQHDQTAVEELIGGNTAVNHRLESDDNTGVNQPAETGSEAEIISNSSAEVEDKNSPGQILVDTEIPGNNDRSLSTEDVIEENPNDVVPQTEALLQGNETVRLSVLGVILLVFLFCLRMYVVCGLRSSLLLQRKLAVQCRRI